MTLKQKFIAVMLSVIFIGSAIYLVLLNYNQSILINSFESSINDEYILDTIPTTVERYKIINIVYAQNKVYAIIHLDNGNIKVVQINEAYIDSNLKNINEGYLYRDNVQIYIKAE